LGPVEAGFAFCCSPARTSWTRTGRGRRSRVHGERGCTLMLRLPASNHDLPHRTRRFHDPDTPSLCPGKHTRRSGACPALSPKAAHASRCRPGRCSRRSSIGASAAVRRQRAMPTERRGTDHECGPAASSHSTTRSLTDAGGSPVDRFEDDAPALASKECLPARPAIRHAGREQATHE
jgi:hypothetical protein